MKTPAELREISKDAAKSATARFIKLAATTIEYRASLGDTSADIGWEPRVDRLEVTAHFKWLGFHVDSDGHGIRVSWHA
jgi:hypothetical protein